MASYSKKYTHPSNPADFLFITWDQGYRNVNVYQDGVLLGTVATALEIMRGASIETPNNGTLELGFTREKPLRLTVLLNKERYYADKETTADAEFLNGISYAFWVLGVLGVIGFGFLLSVAMPLISNTAVLVGMIMDGLIVLTYLATAALITRGVVWLYYVGTSIYLLTTLIATLSLLVDHETGTIVVYLIRVAILVYLLTFFMKVVRMKNHSKHTSSEELLDI